MTVHSRVVQAINDGGAPLDYDRRRCLLFGGQDSYLVMVRCPDYVG